MARRLGAARKLAPASRLGLLQLPLPPRAALHVPRPTSRMLARGARPLLLVSLPPPHLPHPHPLPYSLLPTPPPCQVALERGDRHAAMAQYERILGKAALGRGPAEHWAHADYGWLLFQEGDTQGARQHLEDALRVATQGCAVTDSQVRPAAAACCAEQQGALRLIASLAARLMA